MKSCAALRRCGLGLATAGIFGLVSIGARSPDLPPPSAGADQARPSKGKEQRSWPMYGGSWSRNMVSTIETNIPDFWSVEAGKEKNIKWVARHGSRGFGGPVIAGGKIFVGTNNQNPRDPNIKGDKGILMCFREADGRFLWQLPHTSTRSRELHGAVKPFVGALW